MIVINDDFRNTNLPKLTKPWKGKTIKNFLVLEDVWDCKDNSAHLRKCICKCMKCGRVYFRVSVAEMKLGRFRCECSKTKARSDFKALKHQMIKFLNSERNRLAREAIFKEDYERIRSYDFILNFLTSQSLKNYFLWGLDKEHRLC